MSLTPAAPWHEAEFISAEPERQARGRGRPGRNGASPWARPVEELSASRLAIDGKLGRVGSRDAGAQRIAVVGDELQPPLGGDEASELAHPRRARDGRSGQRHRGSARLQLRELAWCSRPGRSGVRGRGRGDRGGRGTRGRRRTGRARCRSRTRGCSWRPIPARSARPSAAAIAGRPAARLMPRISLAPRSAASAWVVRSQPSVSR